MILVLLMAFEISVALALGFVLGRIYHMSWNDATVSRCRPPPAFRRLNTRTVRYASAGSSEDGRVEGEVELADLRQIKTISRHSSAHSITSSAICWRWSGTSRPSALAVLRLITSSNLVGCSTGKSAGLAPLKTRST